MADVYVIPQARLTRLLANDFGVQAAMDEVAASLALAAETDLQAHRRPEDDAHDGPTRIEVEVTGARSFPHDPTDRLVSLVNDAGAAVAIEYGRPPGKDGRGRTQGLFILTRAADTIGGAP